MPSLRDTVIVFLEDLIENEILDEAEYQDRASELLEALEDERDTYGSRPWDED